MSIPAKKHQLAVECFFRRRPARARMRLNPAATKAR
jgi:hypothetical protein